MDDASLLNFNLLRSDRRVTIHQPNTDVACHSHKHRKKLLTLRRCVLQPNSPLAAYLISPAPTSNTASTFFKSTSPNTASPPPAFCTALMQIPASPVPSIIQRINIEQLVANIDTK